MTAPQHTHPDRPAGPFTVNPALTATRPRRRERRVVENDDYARFARRIVAAHGRRVATGDVDALAGLLDLEARVRDALTAAVTGLRTAGYSWAEIAARTGTTRQAVHARWASTTPEPR